MLSWLLKSLIISKLDVITNIIPIAGGTRLKIYEARCYFDLYCEQTRSLGIIDVSLDKDVVKIDYVNVNNELVHGSPVSEQERQNLYSELFEYAESFAKRHNVLQIDLDVHSNFEFYEQVVSKHGYKRTMRKCRDNPFWEITTKKIKSDHFK
jgi:hypothetical protein